MKSSARDAPRMEIRRSAAPRESTGESAAPPRARRRHAVLLAALIAAAGVLALIAALTDSATFDETSHLTAGYSYLRTGDFRLAADHPPLAKIWCAWPLLFADARWVAPDDADWRDLNVFQVGRKWLFELNDPDRLLVPGRVMMILLLLATLACTYIAARRLFGPRAALLTLGVAALSPELLAHGHFVTTDLPITLLMLLTLLLFARLMERVTWGRLAAVAAALGAASVTKLSWPLVLPALVVMAAVAVLRRAPLESAIQYARRAAPAASAPFQILTARGQRLAIFAGSLLILAFTTWGAVWACYGFRADLLAVPAAAPAATQPVEEFLAPTVAKISQFWQRGLFADDGRPRPGAAPALVRFAAAHRLLPDAYLLGLAMTVGATSARPSYLAGEYSNTGFTAYFPVAFALKTPLATLALFVLGVLALRDRRVPCRDGLLLIGLATFAAVYVLYVVSSHFNIGHRHLLPIYPALYIIAGAAAGQAVSRWGRWLIGGLVLWLVAANFWVCPHYLAYFNELAGGPVHGGRYLADSNLDWGQDLKRLTAYARAHPAEQLKLAYFGSARPAAYGLDAGILPSYLPLGPSTELSAGTYVVSATQLLGVYDPEIRDAFWQPQARMAYATVQRIAAELDNDVDPPAVRQRRSAARQEYGDLRYKRLLNRLQHRAPDARVGYSLLLFRLMDADIADLTEP